MPLSITESGNAPDRQWLTLEDERQEVLRAVWETALESAGDENRLAACSTLLRHLDETAPWLTRVRVS